MAEGPLLLVHAASRIEAMSKRGIGPYDPWRSALLNAQNAPHTSTYWMHSAIVRLANAIEKSFWGELTGNRLPALSKHSTVAAILVVPEGTYQLVIEQWLSAPPCEVTSGTTSVDELFTASGIVTVVTVLVADDVIVGNEQFDTPVADR